MKTPKSIEVVRTSVKGLSSMSNQSAVAIVASLSGIYSKVTLTIINTAEDLKSLIERKPDLVFLGVMSLIDNDKKIWVSEQLEAAGIPHTGSTRNSHELEINKDKAKQQVIDSGLTTAPFRIVSLGEVYSEQSRDLKFPLFVKPLNCGGGKGIDEFSIVRTAEELDLKIASLQADLNVDVLVENYLEGREFSVAIIRQQDSDKLIAMPIELIAPKDSNGERMLSNNVKFEDTDKAYEVNDTKEYNILAKFGMDVFRALGARDYGRIDIRLDKNGVPNFLEANLMPSLINNYGSFPRAYKLNRGVKHIEMINNIALLGLSRAKTI